VVLANNWSIIIIIIIIIITRISSENAKQQVQIHSLVMEHPPQPNRKALLHARRRQAAGTGYGQKPGIK
jgi:hypothetical protein